jgi:hypothetical protein
MYSDYHQVDRSQRRYLSVFLRTTSLPLYVSSFIIVRDSSGLKAENSRPCMEVQCCETRQMLISPNENWKEKAQLISSRWRFLSTGLGGRAALSSLLGELLFPASPPEKQTRSVIMITRCL